ncbi:MAG TPA: YXWGXW repeat-containing protein [Polyangiaceae bacterium]|nr:YXWGXW repeat-containing protein [Polyangiaceae bacterium]
MRKWLTAVCLAGALMLSCASRPPPAVHCADPMVVAYPPPPAQVEHLGVSREAPCTWVDGSWEWVGRRWQWTPGTWVVPPAGCSRAGPITVWLPSEGRGVLYYRPASFCPLAGSADPRASACPAPKPCPGVRAAPSTDGNASPAPAVPSAAPASSSAAPVP